LDKKKRRFSQFCSLFLFFLSFFSLFLFALLFALHHVSTIYLMRNNASAGYRRLGGGGGGGGRRVRINFAKGVV